MPQQLPGLINNYPAFGQRVDGTQKGNGFLGVLQRPDGGVSTEISMGTSDVDGTEQLVPLLVPTLTQKEVKYLLSAPPGDWKHPVMRVIVSKAVAHAKQRKAANQPYFANYTEQNTRILPQLARTEYPDRPVPSHASRRGLQQIASLYRGRIPLQRTP